MNSQQLKPFEKVLFDGSDVEQLPAEEAIFQLYNSVNLSAPLEYIWKPNLLECVEYVRREKLTKTSVKKEFIKDLAEMDTVRRIRRWNNIHQHIHSELLLQSNITVFPQINIEGHSFITGNLSLVTHTRRLFPWVNIYNNISFFIPLEKKCILSETRLQVYGRKSPEVWQQDFEYHRGEGKPAIHVVGTNKFDQYWLNGVLIPNKFFKVPPEQLDLQSILKLPNVEQRMELIKYIGMELMLSKLPHRVIDAVKPYYELLWIKVDISRRDNRIQDLPNPTEWIDDTARNVFTQQEMNCYYLKMLNPSTGAWHVEAVHPTCRTVQQALNWRAANVKPESDWIPEQIT